MRVYSNFDLTEYNSYRIEARCRTAFFPETEIDIIELYKTNKDFLILGSGHNIIFSKNYYDTDFIIFNGNYNKTNVNLETNTIEAEAGVSMFELSELALDNSLSGIEIFYDIPSSLGGAIVMNAGASGEEIKDVLIKVRYLDLTDIKIKIINKEDLSFEYRNSFFQKNTNKVVLKAWLQLQTKEKAEIKHKMEITKSQRWAKQPREFPNAGSVFKRPKGYYVGTIIDELGLKGYAVGGAKVSEKHGGFIISFNNATGTDILNIIDEIRKRVRIKYKLDLEVEQRII